MNHDEVSETQLQTQLKDLEAWVSSPITREVQRENLEKQEQIINVVLYEPVCDVQSLVSHFTALGILQGLRQSTMSVHEALEGVRQQIKERN